MTHNNDDEKVLDVVLQRDQVQYEQARCLSYKTPATQNKRRENCLPKVCHHSRTRQAAWQCCGGHKTPGSQSPPCSPPAPPPSWCRSPWRRPASHSACSGPAGHTVVIVVILTYITSLIITHHIWAHFTDPPHSMLGNNYTRAHSLCAKTETIKLFLITILIDQLWKDWQGPLFGRRSIKTTTWHATTLEEQLWKNKCNLA